ncbi:MAG TPA: hypothetical protein VD931_16780, partial [Baekduia sp.]|nr:hypothetical protein [Baekduia sp.]
HPAPAGMRVALHVTADRMAGHNLHVTTKGFRWAPQRASGAHRAGEGHAHLYVDGKKQARLYGAWYHLGDLAKGRHTIRVTLNGNDHGDYVRDGRAVGASRTVTVR